jgi:hypothetical protein
MLATVPSRAGPAPRRPSRRRASRPRPSTTASSRGTPGRLVDARNPPLGQRRRRRRRAEGLLRDAGQGRTSRPGTPWYPVSGLSKNGALEEATAAVFQAAICRRRGMPFLGTRWFPSALASSGLETWPRRRSGLRAQLIAVYTGIFFHDEILQLRALYCC